MNLNAVFAALVTMPVTLLLSPHAGSGLPAAQASQLASAGTSAWQRASSPTGTGPSWESCSTKGRKLDYPVSIAVDDQGNMYAGNVAGSDLHVQKLSSDCRPLLSWNKGTNGSPYGIVVNQAGNIVVTADERSESSQVAEYSPAGKQLRSWNISGLGLAIDSHGTLYIASEDDNGVSKLLPNGKPQRLGPCCKSGSRPGQFSFGRGSVGLAVDAQGNIYVADAENDRIQKLSPTGQPLAQWGHGGIAPGQFDAPTGVALDSQGDIFVADTLNDRIQELSPAGRPLAVWGGAGGAPGEFWAPAALAFDRAGDLYVADTGNDRIQKLPLAQGTQPAAPTTETASPVTTPAAMPTPVPTQTQPSSADEVLFASIAAMRSVGSVHGRGTITDRIGSKTATQTFTSDCGIHHLALDDRETVKGKKLEAQLVSVENGIWIRGREIGSEWNSWRPVIGDEVLLVLGFFQAACPHERLRGDALVGPLPDKMLPSTTIDGVQQWHLFHRDASSDGTTSRIDAYVSQETRYWTRWEKTDVSKSKHEILKTNVKYSKYNEPLNIQRPKGKGLSAPSAVSRVVTHGLQISSTRMSGVTTILNPKSSRMKH